VFLKPDLSLSASQARLRLVVVEKLKLGTMSGENWYLV
jgi:hypothetical protein